MLRLIKSRLMHKRSGQLWIEFALALPLLLLVFAGMLVLGLAINARIGVANAAHEVGRLAAVNTDTTALQQQAVASLTGESLSLTMADGSPAFDPNRDLQISRSNNLVHIKITYRQQMFVPLIADLFGGRGWGNSIPVTGVATFYDETAAAGP